MLAFIRTLTQNSAMTEKTTKASGKSRGRYARSEETRARILQAAMEEAIESGFQNTSMAKISARAGVAVGILNYHFNSRQELLRQIMRKQMEDFLSSFTPPVADDDFFVYEEKLLDDYLKFLRSNPNFIRLSEEARLHDPDIYYQGIQAHADFIRVRIRRGIKRGDLRPMRPDEISSQAYFIMGSLTFLDRLLLAERAPKDNTIITSFLGLLRKGLAP